MPILWISGNVHGDEPSGTDAALRVLRDLGDRSDCAAAGVLDNALVVVLPTQNPDGREAGTRQNAYEEQYLTQWVSLSSAARNRRRVLAEWRQMTVDAYEQGRAGRLEPNRIYNPPNQIDRPVPDREVRQRATADATSAGRAARGSRPGSG